jgi:hypothetical protein
VNDRSGSIIVENLKRRRSGPLVAILAGAGLLVAVHLVHRRYVFDDAYIHFRIARHLADFGQPFYNGGERIKTSSSSGWTLLVALVFKLVGGSQISAVSVLNGLTLFGLGACAARILRQPSGRRVTPGWAVAGAVLVVGGAISASSGLMETALAALLLTVSFLALMRDKAWGFAVLGVAVGIRLEALVFAAIAGAIQVRYGRNAIKTTLLVLGGWLPFVLYDLWFFRTIIPQPVRAKAITYGLGSSDSIVTATSEFLGGPLDISLWLGCVVVTTVCMVVVQSRLGWSLDRRFFAGFVLSGPVLLAAYVLAKAYVFPWYLPLYYTPMIVGAVWLAVKTRSAVFKALAVIVVLPAVAMLIGKGAGLLGRYDFSISSHANARVNQYLAIGESFREVCQDCEVMTTEIGGLGFTFDGPIIDAVGLVTPAATGYHPMDVPRERPGVGVAGIPPQFVVDALPDVVVSADGFAYALLRSEIVNRFEAWACPPFVEADEQIHWPDLLWGIERLWVLVDPSRTDPDVIGNALTTKHRCVSLNPKEVYG